MRILIINFEYPPLGGGGGVATQQTARELARHHDIHILTTWFVGLSHEERTGNIVVHRVSVLGRTALPTASLFSLITFVPAAFLRGLVVCRRFNFDVINAQFVLPSGIPGVLLAKLFAIPLVVSFIGGDLYEPTKGVSPHRYALLRWIVRLIARHAVACTAISEDTKRRAQELHKVTAPIMVTHLGIKPQPVPTATRLDFAFPDNVPLFVSIGRLIPRKCYDVLITAWRDLPGVHLAIVGDGPLQAMMHNLALRFGILDRVHLLGFIDEVRKQQLLRVADGYVSAAEHEGFGIVFLEAMEAGLPIVATDEGGHSDFLVHEQNALLTKPHQPYLIVAAVQRLLYDTVLRKRMMLANKEAVKRFSVEKTVGRFERILLKASQQNKR